MKCKLFINNKEVSEKKIIFGQYRKKPIVIIAVQMKEAFEVDTYEGTFRGQPNDWLIKGVEGELYPCKDSVFKETYEPAS